MEIKYSKNNLRDLLLILTIPIMLGIYTIIQYIPNNCYSLATDIDKNLPFVKFFIVPYLSWYGFLFIVPLYFYFKDREMYFKTMWAYTICLVICCIIYCMFQTTVSRPYLIGNDIFTKLISLTYSNDKPVNCFPSVHVITSFIMIKSINHSKAKNKLNSFIIYTLGVLIIISTQFIKQHVILDLTVALLLGNIVFNIVNNFNKESFFNETAKNSCGRR